VAFWVWELLMVVASLGEEGEVVVGVSLSVFI